MTVLYNILKRDRFRKLWLPGLPPAKLHINTGLDKNLFFRLASDFGQGVSGMGIQSVNNANSLYMPLEIEGSALLLNAATKGRVGIGTASPQGALDIDGYNANGWSYFRANAQGFNPSGAINSGLIIGWNQSVGQGETQVLYGSGLGGSPRLDFGL